VVLVKPQFEAGRVEASRGKGIIRDPGIHRRTLGEVASALSDSGAAIMGAMPSPITGQAGNVEFLLYAVANPPAGVRTGRSHLDVESMLDAAVEAAHQPVQLGNPT